MKRVVVTGMAGITSLGETADDILRDLKPAKAVYVTCRSGSNMLTFGPSLLGLLKHFIFQNILTVRLPVVWGV